MAPTPLAVTLLYYVLPAAACLTSLAMAYWVYTSYWSAPGSRWFLAMLLTGAVLSLCHLAIAVSPDPAVQWAAIFPRVIAMASFVMSFVLFASAYTGRGLHRGRSGVAVGVAFGAYVVAAATSPFHDLLLSAYGHRSDPFGYVVAEPTVVFGLWLGGMTVLVGYATYAMVAHLLATKRQAGWQIVLVLVGISSIGLFEVGGKLGVFPASGMSHGGYGVLPFLVFVFLAIFQFDFLDVQPVARTTVVEELRDPVLVLDAERRVVDYNAAARDVWPDVGDDLTRPFEAVCPTLSGALDVEATEGDRQEITLPVAGRERHYSITVSSIAGDGTPSTDLFAVLLRDVTDLRRSLRQLETQNERLDQVASTVSHDLRNPITVADNHVTLIRERVATDGLDPESRDHLSDSLQAIEVAAGRMEAIVEDVLTIAREGKTVRSTATVDLEAVAREAWASAATADATLDVAESRRFEADRRKLLRVLENLFRNAVDHGRADATVTVDATDDGFVVADDGPGVPPEHRDGIFEYGYTTSAGGTGLGLSIVESMVQAHGWTIRLEDGGDGGARFVIDGVGSDPVAVDDGPE